MVAGAGAIMGLSVGTVFHQLIGVWLGGLSALGAVLVVAVVVLLSIRSLERRRPGNPDSGEKAETLAAQAIEHALTAPDCAVARSVVTIARARDIGSTKFRGVKQRDRPASERRAGGRGRRLDVQPSMSATLTPRNFALPSSDIRRAHGQAVHLARGSSMRA